MFGELTRSDVKSEVTSPATRLGPERPGQMCPAAGGSTGPLRLTCRDVSPSAGNSIYPADWEVRFLPGGMTTDGGGVGRRGRIRITISATHPYTHNPGGRQGAGLGKKQE